MRAWLRTRLYLRQRDALLALVLAPAILVGSLADLVRFEKNHLRDAFVGVDLRRQWGGIVYDDVVGKEVVKPGHADVEHFLVTCWLDRLDDVPDGPIDQREQRIIVCCDGHLGRDKEGERLGGIRLYRQSVETGACRQD